jgi:hypothetical protein
MSEMRTILEKRARELHSVRIGQGVQTKDFINIYKRLNNDGKNGIDYIIQPQILNKLQCLNFRIHPFRLLFLEVRTTNLRESKN